MVSAKTPAVNLFNSFTNPALRISTQQIAPGHFQEGLDLRCLPRTVPAELSSQQIRHGRRHLRARSRPEEQGPCTAREYVLHGARHLLTGGPYPLGAGIGQLGMQWDSQTGFFLDDPRYGGRIRAVDVQVAGGFRTRIESVD